MKNRQTIRLQGYNYSLPGAYFVTICVQNRGYLFGEIVNGRMQLNNEGKIAKKYWQEIPKHYPNCILDEFIIMPNHVHGILVIKHNDDNKTVGANNHSPFSGVAPFPFRANNYSPLQQQQPSRIRTSRTIGSIIRGYKIGVTKWFRQNTNIYLVWQRNYWERIIRND